MRILILTFYFEPDLCAGSFRNTALISALKQYLTIDDEVDIVTTMPNRYSSHIENAKEEEIVGNINIKRIKIPKHKSGMHDQTISFSSFAFKTLLYTKKREKYDIVFASSSRLMTAFLGAWISNRQKSKLFLDLRDIFTDTMSDIFAKKKLRHVLNIIKYIERYTINSAKHINLVSYGFENYFRELNKNVTYSFYSNGIDNTFLNYNYTKDQNLDKKIITYAGNIGEGQGLEKIIPQMSKLLEKEFEIHIVGDGGRRKVLVDTLADCQNVKLFDAVDRDELLKIYKNSDYLLLHLNDYDAFKKVLPSKIFEYAATNKFIIAGVGGYAETFIKENVNNSIVFKPCDAKDFYNKFKEIEIEGIDRKEFVDKYTRENIMQKMAQEVYTL